MVNERGQMMPEFVLMLALLTLSGVMVMAYLIGYDYKSGASNHMEVRAATRIMTDNEAD